MALKLERALVFFDLETTGVDPARDRVVQIACIRCNPDGSRTPFDSLVNPEVPIPPEVTAIHHITDEMVRAAPRFKDLAAALGELFRDADLGGFGVTRFDLPMLCAEFARAGLAFDAAGRKIVDALTIFHKFEPRNLSAAYEFYCGKTLEQAHDARADVAASVDIFLAQLDRYKDRPKPRLSLPADMQGIHDFCRAADPNSVDPRGKFIWRYGRATFNFGKHQGRALEEAVRVDRSYVEWLSRAEATTPEVADICRKALLGSFPANPRVSSTRKS